MKRLGCRSRRKNKQTGVTRFTLGKRFYDIVESIGLSHQKYIPHWAKGLSVRQLKILLHWMWKGDGSGNRYNTASRRLADDVQEVIAKIGGASVIGIEPAQMRKLPSGKWVMGREQYYVDRHIGRSGQGGVGERSLLAQIKKKDIRPVHYSGMVYCVTTGSGVIFVRRNGRPFWCGNSWDDAKYFLNMFFAAPAKPKTETKLDKLKVRNPDAYNLWKSEWRHVQSRQRVKETSNLGEWD
jgi:hypothetical protein